jgi:hypothetical protein
MNIFKRVIEVSQEANHTEQTSFPQPRKGWNLEEEIKEIPRKNEAEYDLLWWHWEKNSGLCTCKADTLSFAPVCQH